jgi:medium-chain acyl-[acyl-carrier-protein] hydrolase
MDVEVCPVQLPGRGTRLMERPFTRVVPLVAALADALHPFLDRPFAFFGHSLGTLVSFALARRLRSRYGAGPAHLFVSAGPAPHLPHRHSPIHDLPDKDFLGALRQMNGTPTELLDHRELMELMLPVLRADFALYETYAYSTEPPLDCPITAFGGLHDLRVNDGDLQAWQAHTTASFSIRKFPGGHFFLNEPVFLETLAEELRA